MIDTLFGKLDDIAIERLKAFEDNAIAKNPKGFYVAYSGKKPMSKLRFSLRMKND